MKSWKYLVAEAIIESLQENIKNSEIGSRDFHIEEIKMLGFDEDGCWLFEITSWSEGGTDPRRVERVSMVELCDIVGRAVGEGLLRKLVSVEWSERNPGVLP